MIQKLEAVAIAVMMAGFLLFGTRQTAILGALLVAGGAYTLILPRLIRPHGPVTTELR